MSARESKKNQERYKKIKNLKLQKTMPDLLFLETVCKAFVILLAFSVPLMAQNAAQDVNTATESNNGWKLDESQGDKNLKNKPGIELMHAEEGKYIDLKKSKEGILIFQGGIKIRINQYILSADTVKINVDTGEILGEGGVTLSDGLQVLRGSRFFYDNRLKSGVLYAMDGFFKPLYVMGDYAKVSSSSNFMVAAAFLSTCNAELPHYFIKVKKIWIQPDNRFVALGVVYYVGQVPVFYLPFLVQTDIGTGIRTLFGYNTSRGIFLQNSYYFGFLRGGVLPTSAALLFDYYQYDGLYVGTFLNNKSPNLHYDILLGLGAQTQKDFVNGKVTNDIVQSNGSIQRVALPLQYELNVNLKAKWKESFEKDTQSQINVIFEQYNSSSFNQVFKERKIPENTIDSMAFMQSPGNPMAPINLITWKVDYSENWRDNHLLISIYRVSRWNKFQDQYNNYVYDFYPDQEVLPQIRFTKSWYIVKPVSRFFQGVTNDIDLGTGIQSTFDQGKLFHNMNYADLKTGVRAFFSLFNIIGLTPSVGFGIKRQFYNSETPVEKLENQRQSSDYLYSTNSLFLGPSFFKITAVHQFKYDIAQNILHPFFKAERQNMLGFAVTSDFAPYGFIQASASRDMRQYTFASSEEDHWSPLSVSGVLDYDFANKDNVYLIGLYRPDNFFSQISAKETFYYDIKFKNPLLNIFDVFFQTGGYRFLFINKVKLLKLGVSWNHDFLNYKRDRIRLVFETQFNVFKYWNFNFFVAGNVYSPGTADAPYLYLTQDIFNSPTTNPYNLDELKLEIEHDLHDWVLRLSYSIKQIWIPFGSSNVNYAGYYEQSVFLSFDLKSFGGVGLPKTQLYRFNPRDYPDQYPLQY